MFGIASSRHLQQTFDALSRSHAIIEFKIDGTVCWANDNFCQALGYQLPEIAGQHHRMFCDPIYAASPDYGEFWKKLAHGEHQSNVFRRIAKGGREIWIQASYDPIMVGGKAVKVMKVATDITAARVKAMEDDSKLSAISRSQAVIEFTPTGTILTANANFCEATGYRLAEIEGEHHRMFCDPAYAGSPAYAEFWARLGKGEFFSDEFLRFGKNGRQVWIQAAYNPIIDMSGRVVKIVKFATDVTARMGDIARLGTGLNAIASGDLAISLDTPFVPTMESTRRDFNEAVLKLRTTLATVNRSAAEMASGSHEIGDNASDLAKRTEQQAASLEETAAALSQITTAASESGRSAEEAGRIVNAAKHHAERSSEIVGGAIDAMSEIESSSREINNIIAVIDSIAFQTNLLALNAGVEAARAGDAGKGFAVVAQEVRELAQRSAGAAKEIKGLITTSGSQVRKGVELVQSTGEVLRDILQRIDAIDNHVTAIVSSAREQGTSLLEINTAVSDIDQATQKNAAMAEESTAASHRLAEEAAMLFELLRQFRFDQSAEPASASAPAPAAAPAPATAIPSPVIPLRSAQVARGNLAVKQGAWEEF